MFKEIKKLFKIIPAEILLLKTKIGFSKKFEQNFHGC